MFLINGHKQESLAVSDRATQFGDGCLPPPELSTVKSVCYRRISSDYRMLVSG